MMKQTMAMILTAAALATAPQAQAGPQPQQILPVKSARIEHRPDGNYSVETLTDAYGHTYGYRETKIPLEGKILCILTYDDLTPAPEQ